MTDRPLTTKQEKWKEAFVSGLPGIDCSRAAGYKGNENVLSQVAFKNVRNGKIKAAIDKRRAELEAKTDICVLYIQEEHERAKELAQTKGDIATVTRNIELQGKTIGAYIEKSVNINLDAGQRPPDAAEARRRSDERIAAFEGT